MLIFFFFFFQAEDGIRDGHVTGVQTCALPIAAVEIARRNVAALGLSGCVTVREGDLLSGLGACRADLVVANLPYLPAPVLAGLAPEVVDHEPWVALDGGPDGLSVIRSLVAQAPRWLAPG